MIAVFRLSIPLFFTFPLSRFPTFPLSHFPAFPLSHFPTFPLFHFPTFPLSRIFTFPLSHFPSLSLSQAALTGLCARRITFPRESCGAHRSFPTFYRCSAHITFPLSHFPAFPLSHFPTFPYPNKITSIITSIRAGLRSAWQLWRRSGTAFGRENVIIEVFLLG